MINQSKTLWHNKQSSWFESSELSEVKTGEVLIQALYSMISQGTEKTVLTQELSEVIAQEMSIPYMKGSLADSFTYGYSVVGEVISGKAKLIGKKVHLMHPHQDYMVAKEEDIFDIPASVSLKEATLASNIETAVNAIWDADISLGDRVLICGYGLIGAILATIVNKMPGIQCEVFETDHKRQQLHLDHFIPKSSGHDYDVVFNTTSNQQALQHALASTRLEGKIIELSWYGNQETTLRLGADFHYGRKQIISSQVSHIPVKKQPFWNYKKRKQLVFELLADHSFSHLLASEIAFKEAPKFYHRLRNEKISELSTIICY
ncbi:MAG: threonine dehydrogenase-like Zn-dependent dehydrogenase [Marinoscillum sp.]|jgi:threonine dehydrogenase-like Zn-dependent dehydrogenase